MALTLRIGVLIALLPGVWSCALKGPMSPAEETDQGRKALDAIRSEVGLVQDDALTEYVSHIGEQLAQSSPRKDLPYSFYVVDREEVNAFAVPGGHIFVTRGLLVLADSEDELANVLGHEIGHVAARHYAARSWRKTGGSVLAVLGGIAGSFVGLSEVASRPGRGLIEGYNRDQEREADELGQQMAATAGWDPAAMTAFLRKLERDVIIALGAKPEESLLDSHPATGERIASSEARAAALARAPASEATRESYLQRIGGLTIGQDPRGGVFRKEVFLHPDLNLRVRFPEDWVTVNRPAFVAAIDPPAQIRVESAGPGKDLEAKARAFLRAQSDSEEGPPSRAQTGAETKVGPPGAEPAKPEPAADSGARPPDAPRAPREFLDFRLSKGGKRLLGKQRAGYAIDGQFLKGAGTARVYFVNVGDSAYRITCAMPTRLIGRYMEECDRTASSVGPLRKSDRESVQWTKLEIETAQDGETLRAFNQRTDNRWTESQTAAANGLTPPYSLHAGQQLKVARARTYESSAPIPGDAQQDSAEEEDGEAAKPAAGDLPPPSAAPESAPAP